MDTRPRRRRDIVQRQVDDGETVLYDPLTESLHILNATARLIWESCDGEHTPADVTHAIRARYSTTDGIDVLSDVEQTLQGLAERGLLQAS